MVIDLFREFQLYSPGLVNKMRNCSHNYSSCDINPYHMEEDVWSHTCLSFNELLKLKIGNEKIKTLSGLSVICHDIGKIYTRFSPSPGKIAMYGHAFASIQDTIDFIKYLDNKNYFDNLDLSISEILYYVLTSIGNHMDFMVKNPSKRFSLSNSDHQLFNISNILLHCDINGSIAYKDNDNNFPPVFDSSEDFKNHDSIDNNSRILLFCGPPACGKDTIAKDLGYDIISYDDLRIEIYLENVGVNSDIKNYNDLYGEAFKYCNKNKINFNPYLINKIKEKLNNNSVAICNTNLTRRLRKTIINSIKTDNELKDESISALFLCTDKQTIYKRDIERNKTVGKEVIDKFIYNQQIPSKEEGIDYINFYLT